MGFGVSLFRGKPRLCHLRKTVKLLSLSFLFCKMAMIAIILILQLIMINLMVL